ncbi:hypothetical protein GUJ93_ZPchr0012g19117 [Zizania palustris]|uniref:Uncharacterized protein n=1 Tax=Zizania palustris TaxID=103762 RepID=A0A8J5WRF5_ZIZPA|nr:hypothetical protein GUJ93_ZPchr0012g19117 [Zizania palustris]
MLSASPGNKIIWYSLQQTGKDERVPFLDADLFDVVAGRPEKRSGAWAPHVPQAPAWGLGKAPVDLATPATSAKAKQGHMRERHWCDSDALSSPCQRSRRRQPRGRGPRSSGASDAAATRPPASSIDRSPV